MLSKIPKEEMEALLMVIGQSIDIQMITSLASLVQSIAQ